VSKQVSKIKEEDERRVSELRMPMTWGDTTAKAGALVLPRAAVQGRRTRCVRTKRKGEPESASWSLHPKSSFESEATQVQSMSRRERNQDPGIPKCGSSPRKCRSAQTT
jgi:hypothetical protein